MIKKRTFIDQIELTRTGMVQVRFALCMEENGERIGHVNYHRTAIERGGDVDAQLAAVDADITERPGLKAAAIERDHMVDALRKVCAV